MNATTVIINGKSYTVVGVDYDFGNGVQRVTLQATNGAQKRAMFYNGEFDVWDTPKKGNKFSRVNMRK